MPGLEPGTSRQSMPIRVRLPSALHPCWPKRAHALYIGTGPSGSPRLTTHCSEWPLFSKRSWLLFYVAYEESIPVIEFVISHFSAASTKHQVLSRQKPINILPNFYFSWVVYKNEFLNIPSKSEFEYCHLIFFIIRILLENIFWKLWTKISKIKEKIIKNGKSTWKARMILIFLGTFGAWETIAGWND